MDLWTAIRTRRSVRSYTGEEVSEENIRTMLEAAMLAPSAGNEQPWEFILVRSKETLEKAAALNRFASFAPQAALGVMICMNTAREKYAGMGIIDVAACTENLLLAANALGLGAVWTGVYPVEERMAGFQKLLKLPDQVIPVAFVLVGVPEKKTCVPEERFQASHIHSETWGSPAEWHGRP